MSLRADPPEYADVLKFAGQVLGPCELEQDCSWAHGMSAVLLLRDARGVSWFAKRHRERDRYEAEVSAYREWVPALGGHAPRLHAADDLRSAIIVSAVPGEPVPWPAADLWALTDTRRLAEEVLQREAGVLLRRLHDAQPPLPWDNLGADKIAEFDALMPMASQLLGKRDLALARAAVETLSGLPFPGQVPCHRDYTPRNWLVKNGVQYVIDFEHARLDVWLADLARLHLGIWSDRPDLKDAFLAGYGRQLSDTDRAILKGVAALTATWLVVKAREMRRPALEDAFRTALRRLLQAGA
ncbi:MAG: aminoglycoside phosphotransferase family protein [Actinobacteria bacterium]|nr:aminoglycoside phosphotransferase family protein [Actinomycetota bacterium]